MGLLPRLRWPSDTYDYCWRWSLASSPEALWPFVAETNRFNRDVGLPSVEAKRSVEEPQAQGGAHVPRRRLSFVRMGVPVEWIEEPFEWAFGRRFGLLRRYSSGPFAEVRTQIDLEPTNEGGTRATYRLTATPRNLLGHLVIPVNLGWRSGRSFKEAFRRYDAAVQAGQLAVSLLPSEAPELAPGAATRLDQGMATLTRAGSAATHLAQLRTTLEAGDDLAVRRLRPYEQADAWLGGRAPDDERRAVLELFLDATRIGILDFSWDLLCPVCRVVKDRSASLAGIGSTVHCEVCDLDYAAEWDRSVELSFRPNPAIRTVGGEDYCLAGPGLTPHVVLQQMLLPGEKRHVESTLGRGRHRFRVVGVPSSSRQVEVLDDDHSSQTVEPPTVVKVEADAEGAIAVDVAELTPRVRLNLWNTGERELLLVLERTAWSDHAVTAAEVTSLQRFRDLFATEALASDQRIGVGRLAILFTDLRSSTRMYRDMGDGPAFGHVLRHFDVLREAIAKEGGAIVKTMGDAVLAVFPRPAPAIQAVLAAQRALGEVPLRGENQAQLVLKAGLHAGPCIAVTLNERLDYFGSTINVAARLVGFSGGDDLVVSGEVMADPEVAQILAERTADLDVRSGEVRIRGFGDDMFQVWRIASPSLPPTSHPWYDPRRTGGS